MNFYKYNIFGHLSALSKAHKTNDNEFSIPKKCKVLSADFKRSVADVGGNGRLIKDADWHLRIWWFRAYL